MSVSHRSNQYASTSIERVESGSSCRPPKGSTYLTIGQDFFSIQEYVNEQFNASLHRVGSTPNAITVQTLQSFAPAALMVYTDIQTLRGLSTPVDYGSGIEYAEGLVTSLLYPQIGLQIGLWLNGTTGCHDIVSGALDERVDTLVDYLQHITRASKVFLRVGYEFDNPSFAYDDPILFRQAYRYIYAKCHAQPKCASKTLFVWHSWAAPSNIPIQEYYPGDDVVDWIGISVFQQVYASATSYSPLHDIIQVLDFASIHNKPTMIAESTPFGGISTWDNWFQPTLDLINQYDIGMWCYINCNWESQPMWRNVGFGETRLSTSPSVMEQWNKLVLNNPERRFLMAGSLCGHEDHTYDSSLAAITGTSMMWEKNNAHVAGHYHLMFLSCLFSVFALIGLFVWRTQRSTETSGQRASPSLYGSI